MGEAPPRKDAAPASPGPGLEQESLAAVRRAMAAAGIADNSVSLSYREEMVWYPGGNWIQHLVTATTPDGRSADFCAELALKSPQVTACEIDSYLLKAPTLT